MKIRFYQYSKNDFTIEIKGFFGWNPVYDYKGSFSILKHFESKKEGFEYLKYNMKKNPAHVRILEYQTIIVHKS